MGPDASSPHLTLLPEALNISALFSFPAVSACESAQVQAAATQSAPNAAGAPERQEQALSETAAREFCLHAYPLVLMQLSCDLMLFSPLLPKTTGNHLTQSWKLPNMHTPKYI